MHLKSRKYNPRRGAVAVFVAVCLVAIVGITAIAVEGGLMLDNRRHAQATADASALAAADELFKSYPTYSGKDTNGSAAKSALAFASSNGYNNDGTNNTVTVHIPPTTGPFTGLDGYAEVIVEYNQPRYFSRIWASTDTVVRARAVARGRWATVTDGVIVLDLDQKGSLNAHGNGAINVYNSPVIVNSNDVEGAMIANGGGSLNAPSFQVTGGYTTTGGAQINGTVNTGQKPTPDPLRYLPTPDSASLPAGSMQVQNLGAGAKKYTLSPGRYSGGLSFGSKDTVIMLPGIYYMDGGGFSFSGQSGTSLTAQGVMIYNAPGGTNDKISITGQGSVSISPMTTGIYQGISIFQDREKDVTMKITGNGQFNITGTVYAANAPVMIEGNGDVSVGSQYISRTLDVGGNGNLNITYTPQLAPKTRILTLVE